MKLAVIPREAPPWPIAIATPTPALDLDGVPARQQIDIAIGLEVGVAARGHIGPGRERYVREMSFTCKGEFLAVVSECLFRIYAP